MENSNSYEIMALINEAYQDKKLSEEDRKQLINAELKFLETGEY